jgi:hypothetical protein
MPDIKVPHCSTTKKIETKINQPCPTQTATKKANTIKLRYNLKTVCRKCSNPLCPPQAPSEKQQHLNQPYKIKTD